MRNLIHTTTRRRVALFVATFGMLVTAITFGAVASGHTSGHTSGRVEANEESKNVTASYGGGTLFAADPLGGYWTTTWLGAITSHAGAPTFGSAVLSGIHLTKPIVGMAATPDGQGYWLVASDGGIFTYGDAQFYGSTGALHLNEPIVGMAATPDGQGYWLVASDGGIFTYGDAQFYGSTGGSGDMAMGIIIDPLTTGYTLIQTDGEAMPLPTPGAEAGQSSQSTTTTTTPTSQVPPDATQLADDCQPATIPTATVDASLDSVIADQTGPGWVGGDATYSTQLPDGDEAFVFSDTLLGTAQPSGVTQLSAFIHSSELVGKVPDLEGNFGGTTSAPQTLIPDTTDPGDQWQVSATYVENDDQLVFVNEYTQAASSSAIDQFTGHSGIAIFSIQPDGMPAFDSVDLLPSDPTTQWGTSVTQNGGYTYIFGADFSPTNNQVFYGMKVARVALGSSLITGAWQYWDGAQWVSGEQNAVPVSTTASLTGVTAQQGESGYVAVSIPVIVWDNKAVDLSYACSPTGPWSTPVPVYTIPQVSQFKDEIAYIPTFHPELSTNGLVISYNIDSLDGLSPLEANIHLYQPQFLELSNS
jgi:hypothetical protein